MKSYESYRVEEVFKVFGNKQNYRFLGPVGYRSYSAFSVYSDPNMYYSKFRDMADVAGSWGQKEPERVDIFDESLHNMKSENFGGIISFLETFEELKEVLPDVADEAEV
ncbi:hypothetical protein Tco_0762142 [Tanacetum coccineum]